VKMRRKDNGALAAGLQDRGQGSWNVVYAM